MGHDEEERKVVSVFFIIGHTIPLHKIHRPEEKENILYIFGW